MSDLAQQMLAMLEANPMIEEHYPCAVEFRKAVKDGRVTVFPIDSRKCVQCGSIVGEYGKKAIGSPGIIWPKFCPHCGKENPSGK